MQHFFSPLVCCGCFFSSNYLSITSPSMYTGNLKVGGRTLCLTKRFLPNFPNFNTMLFSLLYKCSSKVSLSKDWLLGKTKMKTNNKNRFILFFVLNYVATFCTSWFLIDLHLTEYFPYKNHASVKNFRKGTAMYSELEFSELAPKDMNYLIHSQYIHQWLWHYCFWLFNFFQ